MTALGDARLERFANGATISAIARADGVTPGAVQGSLSSAIGRRARGATPGSELPAGLEWHERSEVGRMIGRRDLARWYVSGHHRPTPAMARWALALEELRVAPCCPVCGRTL